MCRWDLLIISLGFSRFWNVGTCLLRCQNGLVRIPPWKRVKRVSGKMDSEQVLEWSRPSGTLLHCSEGAICLYFWQEPSLLDSPQWYSVSQVSFCRQTLLLVGLAVLSMLPPFGGWHICQEPTEHTYHFVLGPAIVLIFSLVLLRTKAEWQTGCPWKWRGLLFSLSLLDSLAFLLRIVILKSVILVAKRGFTENIIFNCCHQNFIFENIGENYLKNI